MRHSSLSYLFVLSTMVVVGCKAEGPGADSDTDAAIDRSDRPIEAYDPLAWVDPFIATAGVGAEVASVTPGASWPNGMSLFGPDTSDANGFMAPFYVCVGYHGSYDHIRAFSVVHEHGIGIVDLGAVPFMVRDGWDPADADPKLPVAPFDKSTEAAGPGWYEATLTDQDIDVRVVATERGGHVTFSFAEGAEPVVQLDLGHVLPGVETLESRVEKGASGAFSGEHRVAGGYSKRYGGSRTFFAGQLDPAPVGGGTWTDPASPQDGGTVAEGSGALGAWWVFPEGTREVHLRVAVSYTDEDGARANLAAELPDTDQDARFDAVQAAWRERLGAVRVLGGTERERRIFHTAMYHALLMPSRQDDVDGRYRGLDQQLHTTDHPYYSDFSLWDTFRTLHPWYLLAWPDLQADLDRSLLRMTRDGGSLPRWPMTHGYTGGMVGTPAIQVLAESWHKGVLPEGLVDEAVAVSIKASTAPQADAGRRSLTTWTKADGWIPIESGGGAVSHALEYAWSDGVLARWLDALGRKDDAATIRVQADNWRNHWSAADELLIGRWADGRFRADVMPYVWSDDYVEGNAWHYVWMVPWDVPGLIEVQHGGDRQAFVDRLAAYWDRVYVEPDDLTPDDDYWHGNEPVMTNAFLASLAGSPDVTAEASRWILEHRYDDSPDKGLDGNDDAGTLSAWAAWAMIGLFPVAGTPDLALASPVFERVEVDRPDGTWVLRAPGASAEARYLSGVTVDGEPWTAPVLDFNAAMSGEVLLEMTTEKGSWSPDL